MQMSPEMLLAEPTGQSGTLESARIFPAIASIFAEIWIKLSDVSDWRASSLFNR